jgi:phosphoglycerate dehydrogenase-like enzyme
MDRTVLVLVDPLVLPDRRLRLQKDLEAAAPGERIILAGTPQEALEHAPEAEVASGWQLPSGFVERAPHLRWIHALTAGVDHLVGLPAVSDGRVTLTRTVGIHTVVMPEHIMAIVLAFSRHLHVDIRNQIAHRWDRPAGVGGELHGLTMGVLGLGTIGQALAARAAAFGMRVIGTKRTPDALPHVESVFPPERMDEVLRAADYLVALVPVTPATRGLLGEREFRLMKSTAVLINVSRGVVVQERALVTALREGWIAGAGLDVFEQEPLPPDHPFYAFEQVIVTPHVSGVTPRYFDRVIALLCDNLRRYVQGAPLLHVVDPRRGY